MFERYTEKARRTIFFSRYEASQFGSPYIETEHLLLGLIREDKALVRKCLGSHDTFHTLESIRKQIEDRATISEKVSTSVDLPLSNECKRILAYAMDEADKVSDKWIGTGHLLLGMLREPESLAAKLLSERGVTLELARVLLAEHPQEPVGSMPKSPGLPSGYVGQTILYNRAAETLILELGSIGARMLLPSRIFMRHKDAEAYEPIGTPAEDVSYESPVTCEKHPVVVFNSMKLDSRGSAREWGGVLSFDLKTKTLEQRISTEKLRLSEPHGRLWISELVSLSEDALAVYARIAFEKEVTGGRMVHYYIAASGFVALFVTHYLLPLVNCSTSRSHCLINSMARRGVLGKFLRKTGL